MAAASQSSGLTQDRQNRAHAQSSSTVGLAARSNSASSKLAKQGSTSKFGRGVALPTQLSPQLATLVDQPPQGDDWLYEIKFDGYRLLTRIEGDSVVCFTRSGKDWSHKLAGLVSAIRALKLSPCWLDGELVVLDSKSVPDFQALQNAFDNQRTDALTYFVFDLPFYAGKDLRSCTLTQRREQLRSLISSTSGMVRFSDSFGTDPTALLASAREVGLEGLIGKRKESKYKSQRSADWIKLKTSKRQEFVIGGYTDPQGSRDGLGALLLGIHDSKGRLRYAGNVGTGFSVDTLRTLKKRLSALHRSDSPFDDGPSSSGVRGTRTHWVQPSLLAEVSFAQWTSAGRVRHSVFHGLREDKSASKIEKETPAAVQAPPQPDKDRAAKITTSAKGATARAVGSTKVTHATRVIDAVSGVTKGELVDFYARVGEVMLGHLKSRPVALVRAPAGVSGAQFFQKHAEGVLLEGVKRMDGALDPGHEPLLEVFATQGLLSAAQMNVVEFHTWNMTARTSPRPDRMLFDLDPGSGVEWPAVQEAARLIQSFLQELSLASFLKTSGGNGLHVVVPLTARHDWQLVRAFSKAIVEHLVQVAPQRLVAKSGPRNRVGKIYIDYLRNNWGATTACAWSARARPGMGVSVPVEWSELNALTSGAHWTVANIDSRLAVGNDPWKGYAGTRQTLTVAMKGMNFKPSKLAE